MEEAGGIWAFWVWALLDERKIEVCVWRSLLVLTVYRIVLSWYCVSELWISAFSGSLPTAPSEPPWGLKNTHS